MRFVLGLLLGIAVGGGGAYFLLSTPPAPATTVEPPGGPSKLVAEPASEAPRESITQESVSVGPWRTIGPWTATILSTANGTLLQKLSEPGNFAKVESVSLSADNKLLALTLKPPPRTGLGGPTSEFELWDVTTGRKIWALKDGLLYTLSPNGKTVAVSRHYDEEIAVWDVQSQSKTASLNAAPYRSVQSIAVWPNSSTLAVLGDDDGHPNKRIWSRHVGRPAPPRGHLLVP